MPQVSVLLCCYNAADTIAQALDSLRRQTVSRSRFEVVVVNDGSTDTTEAVVAGYRKALPVQYVHQASHLGLARACNRGLDAAKGEYLIRLDADDTCEPTMLERLMPPLRHEQTDLVYCDRYEWVAEARQRRTITLTRFNLFRLLAIGTMMRTALVRTVGGWRHLFWEEYDLYLRYLLRSGKPPVRIPEPLLTYTIHAGSMTADPVAVHRGWEELQRLWPPQTLEQFGCIPQSSTRAGAIA